MKNLETNFNWMTLEMTETDRKSTTGQGPQRPEEVQQAQAADNLQAQDAEVQGGIFGEIEEPPQEPRRIDITKKGLSMYPHLEINAVLEEVDEGRPVLGIEEPTPPEQAKGWRLYGKGPEARRSN